MPLKQIALKYLPDSVLKPVRARHYQDQLKHYDLNDEPDLLGCKALLRAGDVVFDIGANIGVYTRFCSEFVGPTGQIHSLEPIPETFSYLTSNVRALNPRLIKCDVEGHEVPCINGALELIARSRPVWVVEVSSSRTFELFVSLNYDAYLYEHGAFRITTPADKTPNYFFFPHEQSSLVSNPA